MNITKASIPVFSGNSEDLRSFVDMILADMTDEQLAYYCYPTFASEGVVTPSGYELPPSAVGGYDGVGGVYTDLPMPIHIGQSWDREIARKYGEVKGDERRGMKNLDDPNSLIFTPTTDIRVNPLWGRWYEGFGEDAYLITELSAEEGNGLAGDDPFYLKAQPAFKHYSSYCSEWDRLTGTCYVGSRYLYECHFDSALKILEKSRIVGVMTAFGAMNGIPYAFTPYIRLLQKDREYALFSYSDFIADYNTLVGMGNGYDDTYAKTPAQVAAMLMKARSFSNNDSNDKITQEDTLDALQAGLLGVTRNDLEEQVRPQVELWVRTGYFNKDEYPYRLLCKDFSPADASDETNQKKALDAAQGGIVLLKNENQALPLSPDASVLITGIFADMHIKPWTSISTPEGISHTGLTALQAMREIADQNGGAVVHGYELTGAMFRVKSTHTGNYISVNAEGRLYANTGNADEATIFQLYDWGQGGYSIIDPVSGTYLHHPFDEDTTDYTMVEIGEGIAPSIFTRETSEDGYGLSRWGAIPSIPFHTVVAPYQFYEFFNQYGNYLSIDGSGKLVIGPAKGEALSSASYFEFEKVLSVGENAGSFAEDHDTVVAFLGSDSFVNASETTDRKNLDMGSEQMELISKLSESFEKVIVVLNTNLPLGVEAIQNNPNVDAVLLTAYGGQYESYALAQALYGEINPSGKLTTSWLKDLSTLPVLRDQQGIDEQYTVYMKNADASHLGLTYQYNDPDDLIYEFGYGLSYTTFQYTDITIEPQSQAADDIRVAVTVTNTGNRAGREVLQVYMYSKDSRYGEHVPKKQLVAFIKTSLLEAGASEQLTIAISPDSYRKWDVTTQAYIVEAGLYTIMLGNSSERIFHSEDIIVFGNELGTLDIRQARNVWDSCYASAGVTGFEVSKRRTADFEQGLIGILSEQPDSYAILPKVDLSGITRISISVAGIEDSNTIDVYSGSMDGPPLLSVTFNGSQPVSYYLDAAQEILVQEPGYDTVSGDIAYSVEAIQDLYLVFRQSGIRVDTLVGE